MLDGNSTIGAPGGDSAIGNTTGQLGTGNDNLLSVGAGAATAGIGILRRTGSAVLKLVLMH